MKRAIHSVEEYLNGNFKYKINTNPTQITSITTIDYKHPQQQMEKKSSADPEFRLKYVRLQSPLAKVNLWYNYNKCYNISPWLEWKNNIAK